MTTEKCPSVIFLGVYRGAQAQIGDLGKKAMETAGKSGGSLGSVAELGTSIVEMRDHVTALNANLDKLEKIKSALGGG